MTDVTQPHTQRIGLLVVHGIGEQKRFETAAAMTRSLTETLKARGLAVAVTDRSGALSTGELACPSEQADDCPYRIVAKGGGRATSLHIHEVWWADIGQDKGFWETFGFWMWALGQWNAIFVSWTHFPGGKSNTDVLMQAPVFPRDGWRAGLARVKRWLTRPALFVWGFAAFVTFVSWSALKWVYSWLSSYIGNPSIITEYVDRVRVYTETVNPYGGSVIDMGMPWRATIRRRMIAETVAMAERGYDRWYILAHSQGSVLGFNAIEETEWALPNYLQEPQYRRLPAALRTATPFCPDPAQRPDLTRMMPARPPWLAGDEGLSRAELFKSFRGLVTYGSPLNKFASLWTPIVYLNTQTGVFSQADWVNLWDAHDPIGAYLDAFSGSALRASGPKNVHVRASCCFLWAHIRYFKPRSRETEALLDVLLARPDTPQVLSAAFAALPAPDGFHFLRKLSAFAQSVALLLLLSALAGALAYSGKSLIRSLFRSLSNRAADVACIKAALQIVHDVGVWLANLVASRIGDSYTSAVVFVWLAAAATVFVCGVVRRIRENILVERRR